MAENADSALPPVRPAERGAFWPRVASALVLIPAALAAVSYGSPWLPLLTALAAGIMSWEWGRLVGRIATPADGALLIGPALAAVLVAGFLEPWLGLVVAAGGIALQHALARGRDAARVWTAVGLAWIVAPSIAFLWLRSDPAAGFATAIWVLALVWATDTAAYAAGKTIGGARLAPRISPNKTWAGLLGGVLGAMLAGLLAGAWTGSGSPLAVALVSGGLAIVGQIGDMAESYAKRRFGAKDTSSLIPGHGGLLDRLDGMLAVVSAVALLEIVTGGSVLTWR